MSKKAVLDIGSLKMKVAIFDVEARKLLSSDSHLTLLGKDLSETHHIHESSLEMLQKALELVAAQLKVDAVKDVVIIGTEALRTANNTDKVNLLINEYFPGHTLDIIDQEREAELFFTAISKEFPDTDIVAMDIGGGSVQLIEGVYNTKDARGIIKKKYTLPTGTYKLQQQYSPNNDEISTQLELAESVIREAYESVTADAPILVFGSSVMADFITASGIKVSHDTASLNHTMYVGRDELGSFLTMLKTLRPDSREVYYPEGAYFMYGADYLLMNVIDAADRINPEKIYPTNLNTSYAFIEEN
jgi:exopolyphosphatase/pppGpp-phosphohydrolase